MNISDKHENVYKPLYKALVGKLTESQYVLPHRGDEIFNFYTPWRFPLGEDSSETYHHCICGVRIKDLYLCKNIETDEGYIIGSKCILHFGEKGIQFIKNEVKFKKLTKIKEEKINFFTEKHKKKNDIHMLRTVMNVLKKPWLLMNSKITFGKYKNTNLRNISHSYLDWMIKIENPSAEMKYFQNILKKYIEEKNII